MPAAGANRSKETKEFQRKEQTARKRLENFSRRSKPLERNYRISAEGANRSSSLYEAIRGQCVPNPTTAPTALSASPTLPPLYALAVLTLTARDREEEKPPMRAQTPSALTAAPSPPPALRPHCPHSIPCRCHPLPLSLLPSCSSPRVGWN